MEEEELKEVNGVRCEGSQTQAIVRELRTSANDPHPLNSKLQAFGAV